MTRATVDTAQQLMRAGRFDDAERAFRDVLESSPDSVEALNAVALGALRRGNAREGLELLQRAVTLAPTDALSHHHLGRVREVTGDFTGALDAEARAVKLNPDFYVSRLHLAALLERVERDREALPQFARALRDAQAAGRLLDAQTTPRHLQSLVQTAVLRVRSGRQKLLDDILRPLIGRFGPAGLQRVIKAVRVYLGELSPEYPDPRQHPTFFFIPDMPASAYVSRDHFAWLPELESQTQAICDEMLQLLPTASGRERVFTSEAIEQENLRGQLIAPSWNGYYLYRYGERREDNRMRCPSTAAALEHLPLIRVREHGPEVLFSVFTPGTHLLPHRGVTNSRLVGHLPLIIPENCALNVGGDLHAWQEGQVVVFDDTYEHEAWNRSANLRVVLIFDIWSPFLSDLECQAITQVVEALGDFRQSIERA